MGKVTIGFFKASNGRKYRIYAHRGYKGKEQYIYVGNSSFGVFFRFNITTTDIWINPNWRDKIGRFASGGGRGYVRLFYPRSKDDIKNILYMLLKPASIFYLEMKIKNRNYFTDKYILESL